MTISLSISVVTDEPIPEILYDDEVFLMENAVAKIVEYIVRHSSSIEREH